ncbi:hypothetical protein Taro_008833 [Colocasia esculenta]|uniref:Uncharacterized protein n=1 Tax=Colocasia esculenta TaxID=4460 RepID=A0A843TYM4_COLES|nr:hypothetical protein [Colocasia esculenta]
MTHNQSQAQHDSRRTSRVKHNAEATLGTKHPRQKKLTEHRTSNNTSTNIPDVHETPSNHERSTVSLQARPPQTSTRLRAHK